ncbi:MAG: rod shape-determining protein RodA [Bacteroidaceae bacterium]|nr:rod shape-determining protein RodA [Bacteroidaceae bacterium]
MAIRNVNLWRSIDWFTIILYFLLVACGWLSICGATYDFGDTDFFSFSSFTGKQLVWIGCALVIAIILLNIEKKYYEMLAYPTYIGFVILLAATIFIAPDIKGSHSWLVIGPIRIQPAEFSKFATALCLSRLLSSYGFSMEKRSDFIKMIAIVVIPMLLIILQDETGSALVYAAFFLVLYREGMTGSLLALGVCMVAYFVIGVGQGENVFDKMPVNVGQFIVFLLIPLFTALAVGVYGKHVGRAWWIACTNLFATLVAYLFSRYVIPFDICIVQLVLCGCTALYLIYTFLLDRYASYLLIALFALGSVGFYYSCNMLIDKLQPHQQMRILVLLGIKDDPAGVGYNINQSKIAIGSGGLWGKGFLEGTQTKLNYVPEQHTDFIFCTIGEEQGFMGCIFILLLYAVFIIRIIMLAERQGSNKFTRVYGYSLASILTFHLFVNVGMVIGLAPVIGIPLPFFSYGGSSLWGFTILLAILLRLDAEREARF